jgi:hypothetical protein
MDDNYSLTLKHYTKDELKEIIENPIILPSLFKGASPKEIYDLVEEEIKEFNETYDYSAFFRNLAIKSASKFHIFMFLYLKEIKGLSPVTKWQDNFDKKKDNDPFIKDVYAILRPHFVDYFGVVVGYNYLVQNKFFNLKLPPLLADEIVKKGYLIGIKYPVKFGDFNTILERMLDAEDVACAVSFSIHSIYYANAIAFGLANPEK